MCLENVYRGKEKKKRLAKLKDVITVWKVVIKAEDCSPWDYNGPAKYVTCDLYFPIYAGEVEFKRPNICGYKGGGHFFLTKDGAKYWKILGRDLKERIVRCKINKADINSIGNRHGKEIVVVKKAAFPKYVGAKPKRSKHHAR
jgi:hypothetical protein